MKTNIELSSSNNTSDNIIVKSTNPFSEESKESACPAIIVPDVILPKSTEKKENTLSFFQIVHDTGMAGACVCEPVSAVCSCLGACTCCVLELAAQEEKNNKRATRRDVIYAKEIKRHQQAQLNSAVEVGATLGACTPRLLGYLIGAFAGLFRAPIVQYTGHNTREDDVCCLSRQDLDDAPGLCGPSACFK